MNPTHPILKNLSGLEPDSALQVLVIDQIYNSALLLEGLRHNPACVVPRPRQIMEQALNRAVI